MCLPLCSVCSRPIQIGDRAVQVTRGEIGIDYEFAAEEFEIIHEDCLADME